MNKININQGTHSSLHDIVPLSFDASHSLSKHLLIFILILLYLNHFQLLCQGVKDVAVCVLVIVDSLVSVEAKTYVQDIFK